VSTNPGEAHHYSAQAIAVRRSIEALLRESREVIQKI
jgi:hypothetical protein